MKILVTGAAGFIGYHLTNHLLKLNHLVAGVDNLNTYYDVNLKLDRLSNLGIKISPEKNEYSRKNFSFFKEDISNKDGIDRIFKKFKPEVVINLAAQAGVRYSLTNPHAYVKSNCLGFLNILEGCRNYSVNHLLYASTSSIYGLNKEMPLNEKMITDHPVSFYAATKKANEVFAHSYSNMFEVPTTGLRFFTVYGPWGRPDMALFLFTDAMVNNKPIDVFNFGNMIRDFTYVDDIVISIEKLLKLPPKEIKEDQYKISSQNSSFYQIFNIGNSRPTNLMDYVHAIEKELGINASINLKPMQKGDVKKTHADTKLLNDKINFIPSTSIEFGVNKFIEWYRKYYSV